MSDRLEGSTPQEILAWAIGEFFPDLTLACSFGGISGMALLDMAVKLCHAGARGAYVLRGRRLVGTVTTGEILKKIAGGR